MALTKEQQKALQESKPQLIAHLKILISNVHNMEDVFKQQERGDIIPSALYRELIAPDTERMDMAIKNLAYKCGALSVETITYDEYKEATDESKT
jgi:hypothetical protein